MKSCEYGPWVLFFCFLFRLKLLLTLLISFISCSPKCSNWHWRLSKYYLQKQVHSGTTTHTITLLKGVKILDIKYRCSTLGKFPDLTYTHYTKLDKSVWDKHCNLLQKSVNNGRKRFYNIDFILFYYFQSQTSQWWSPPRSKTLPKRLPGKSHLHKRFVKGCLHRRCWFGDFAERCDFNS